MNELLKVLGEHLSTVIRELIIAHYHLSDIGPANTPGKMSWAEFADFVLGAGPTSDIGMVRNKNWDRTSVLVATLIEFMGGKINIDAPFDHPGRPSQAFGVPAGQSYPQDNPSTRDSSFQNMRGKNMRPQPRQVSGKQFGDKRPQVMHLSEFQSRYAAQQEAWAKQGPEGGVGGVGVRTI